MGASLSAIRLGAGLTVKQVEAGYHHTCAILSNDRVKCWGYSNDGQLGQGDRAHRGDNSREMGDRLSAIELGTGLTAKQVAVGGYHSCALLSNDTVKCWGYNANGELGAGDTRKRGDNAREMGNNLPGINWGTNLTVSQIALGGNHTCGFLE